MALLARRSCIRNVGGSRTQAGHITHTNGRAHDTHSSVLPRPYAAPHHCWRQCEWADSRLKASCARLLISVSDSTLFVQAFSAYRRTISAWRRISSRPWAVLSACEEHRVLTGAHTTPETTDFEARCKALRHGRRCRLCRLYLVRYQPGADSPDHKSWANAKSSSQK